jgi:DNA-binding response OmpR family regulator
VSVCPQCHQPIGTHVRAGVRMSALKARIFEIVERADRIVGISTRQLAFAIYGRDEKRDGHTIRMHIRQLNELLAEAEAGVRIENRDRRNHWAVVMLDKVGAAA